ncbi:MAG TPA: alpha/beta fold hydrolase [Lacunisphaera sp.]|nr:alpha/beta fold hydrolase [Lacunisphaera sp.]
MYVCRKLPGLVACALLASVALHGAGRIDLTRVVPVPDDQPIPTQDFFRPPALARPLLNRSGTHIAALVTGDEDKHLLLVYAIADGKIETVGSHNDQDIYNIHWLTNSRVLFQLVSRKMYSLGILAADVGRLSRAYALQQSGSILVSVPLKNPAHPLVWNRFDFETGHDEGVAALNSDVQSGSIIDLTSATANMAQVAQIREQNAHCILANYTQPGGPGLTTAYLPDKAGDLAYAIRVADGNPAMFRRVDRQWLPCPVDLETIDIVGNANEPGQLLVRGPALGGKPQPLQLMDAASGRLGDVVLQDPNYDFNGWLYHNPVNGDVLGAVFNLGGPRTFWFNEQYRELQKIFDGMFPGTVVQIVGSDDQHRIFLLATFSDRQPVAYHWVNLETRKAGLFKSSAPWINPTRMRPMQILQFKTRDGYKLDAYLTLPAAAAKDHPAPLVVLCHGGPWARDEWGFDGEAQFLANHGYAVLQPNYRGSTGSTGRFPDGDEYDFIKMHNDVTDAARAVLHLGLIDPGRVAIMGGSFGGYLAVSGVAHETDLYRCAVTNAGVFDWAMLVQAEKFDRFDSPVYGRMVKKLGDPRKETAKYDAMSPIRFVKNIHVPVFVAAGKDDFVVEISQSRRLIAALDDQKVPYEKYFVGGEGHGMAYLKDQVDLYDRILAFLDKNLKAAP